MKRKSSDISDYIKRRTKRRILDIKTKLEIAKRLKTGESTANVAKYYKVSTSTVSRCRRANQTLLAQYNNDSDDDDDEFIDIETPNTSAQATIRTDSSNTHTIIMEKLEQFLLDWINIHQEICINITNKMIQDKANMLFRNLNVEEGIQTTETFQPTTEWIEEFKKRNNIDQIAPENTLPNTSRNIHHSTPQTIHPNTPQNKTQKESPKKVKFTSENITRTIPQQEYEDDFNSEYVEKIQKVIKDGGYLPSQVFNADESGIYWKRLPNNTLQPDSAYTNVSNDRVNVLLCTNAEGDFKLKPLVMYHNENPRSLRGYVKSSLPVIWKLNKTLKTTPEIFEDWFVSHFCPSVEKYCAEKNIPHKVLLLLESSNGHPTYLNDLSNHVRVEYLPENEIIQPIQNAILSFQELYLKKLFTKMSRMSKDQKVRQYWLDYNLMNVINNISESWNEMKASLLNRAWETLWPEVCLENATENQSVLSDIVELLRDLGFNSVGEKDIVQLMVSFSNAIPFEKMLKSGHIMNIFEECKTEPITRELTTDKLDKVFQLISDAQSIIQGMDPMMNRSSAICTSIDTAMECYRSIYKDKKNAETKIGYSKVRKTK